ncbi:hypothetical protein C8F01DRAFT_1080337 [Mycena amicta]|nr:hypothetical protein C8F01DRAFT_1080337 [Mycena amicta]
MAAAEPVTAENWRKIQNLINSVNTNRRFHLNAAIPMYIRAPTYNNSDLLESTMNDPNPTFKKSLQTESVHVDEHVLDSRVSSIVLQGIPQDATRNCFHVSYMWTRHITYLVPFSRPVPESVLDFRGTASANKSARFKKTYKGAFKDAVTGLERPKITQANEEVRFLTGIPVSLAPDNMQRQTGGRYYEVRFLVKIVATDKVESQKAITYHHFVEA